METQPSAPEQISPLRQRVGDIALFARTAFWLFASCLVVYALLNNEAAGSALVDIGVALLFTIAVVLVILAIWPRRELPKNLAEMSIKDWVAVKLETKYFALLVATIACGLGVWLAHVESESSKKIMLQKESNERQARFEARRLEAQERLVEGGHKPGYVTDDEWKLVLGLRSYEAKDYDRALTHFASIKRLDRDSDLVQWKFYEALARLRRLEHSHFKQLRTIDPSEVREISALFAELERRFPRDRRAESILYWHAQLKYQFEGDLKGAQERFAKIVDTYKYGQWRQGALLYSAEILARDDTLAGLKKAEATLQILADRYPTALVRIVDEGVDYRVEEVVAERLQRVRQKISEIEASSKAASGA